LDKKNFFTFDSSGKLEVHVSSNDGSNKTGREIMMAASCFDIEALINDKNVVLILESTAGW